MPLRFGDLPPAEIIAASIEFARLADIVDLKGIESMMAEHIRQVVLANRPDPLQSVFQDLPDKYAYYLRLEHIRSAVLLLKGHPVQKMLVSAVVKGYLLYNYSKSFQEAQGLPDLQSTFLER